MKCLARAVVPVRCPACLQEVDRIPTQSALFYLDEGMLFRNEDGQVVELEPCFDCRNPPPRAA